MLREGLRVFVTINGDKVKGIITQVLDDRRYIVRLLDGGQVIVHEWAVEYEVGL